MTAPDDHTPGAPRPGSGSLLEGLEAPAPNAPRRPTLAEWSRARTAAFASWWRAAWSSKASRALVSASALMLAATGALGAWLAWRPMPTPDYESDRLDTLFRYTLLTDEFNRLPLEERIELIGDLVSRVKGMDGSDSVLMAAFAAQITGPARDQLIDNASRIMVDMTDRAAVGYNPSAPPEERTAYIESAVVEMMRSMAVMTGQDEDVTDEELLAEAREQAARDARAMRSGDVTADDIGQIATLMARTGGASSSAKQKLRMAVFARDMARTLRGQDIETGQPRPDGP